MKNLLLLSMLFLGSCGNLSGSDGESGLGASKKNQFRISNVSIGSNVLSLTISDTLTQVTHDKLSFSGSFMLNGKDKCTFTASKEELTTPEVLKSLVFDIEISCPCAFSPKMEILLFNIPAGVITLKVDGKSIKNNEFRGM